MAKGIGQSGAWAISILISILMFAGIIAMVLSIHETRRNEQSLNLDDFDQKMQDLEEKKHSNAEEHIESPAQVEKEPEQAHKTKAKAEPSHDDEDEDEYIIKADDSSVTPKDKKKVAGLIPGTMDRLFGQI